MTKKQSQLARYVVGNIREVALMNSTQLAFSAKVSESTITRFVYMIGYKNFSEFQLDLRKEAQGPVRVPSLQIQKNEDDRNEPAYKTVYDLEMCLMTEAFLQIDPAVFDSMVDVLCSAKKLLLIGNPTHTFLSQYAYNFMSLFRDDVYNITSIDLPFTSLLRKLNNESAALVFSYPRYPKETLNIVKTLNAKKVQILGVTDSSFSPIVPFCKYYLTTPQKYLILGEANAAVVAMIHSLFLGMYRKNTEAIKDNLKEYEENILSLDMFALKDYNFAKKLK